MKNKNILITMYLQYFNDFLTIERFAEFHHIPVNRATMIINTGRNLLNNK